MWMHLGDCILTVITTHDLVCIHVPLFPRKKKEKKGEKVAFILDVGIAARDQVCVHAF